MMKKRIEISIIILVVIIMFQGCATLKKETDKSFVWKSEQWNYSFVVPDHWKLADKNDPSIKTENCDVYLEGTVEASIAIFAYSRLHKSYTASEIMDEIIEKYRSVYTDFRIIAIDTMKNGDWTALVVKFEGQGQTIKITEIYAVIFSESVDLLISANCPTRVLASNEDDIMNLIRSIKIG